MHPRRQFPVTLVIPELTYQHTVGDRAEQFLCVCDTQWVGYPVLAESFLLRCF